MNEMNKNGFYEAAGSLLDDPTLTSQEKILKLRQWKNDLNYKIERTYSGKNITAMCGFIGQINLWIRNLKEA